MVRIDQRDHSGTQPAGCDRPSQWVTGRSGPTGLPLNLNDAPFPIDAAMGIDFHLIANFAALALITLAGPAVIFILFYRRGAL